MKEIALHINKHISKDEYPFAKFDFEPEEKVYLQCNQFIDEEINNGLVCSIDNQAPYFEIPVPFLNIVDETRSYQLFMTESSLGEFKLYGKTKDYHVIILTIMDKKITKEYTTIDEMEPPF